MKKISIVIAGLLAAMSFSAQARELTRAQEQDMFAFCEIISITAEGAVKARDSGKSSADFKQEVLQAIRQMKQPFNWTDSKLRSMNGAISVVYNDTRIHHFTAKQTKRWFDAACIAEANQGQ